jgi:hypothetical protein
MYYLGTIEKINDKQLWEYKKIYLIIYRNMVALQYYNFMTFHQAVQ